MTIEEVDGALKLRHVYSVAIPVAPVKPGHLIFAVTQKFSPEQIVAQRSLIVQKVLIVR